MSTERFPRRRRRRRTRVYVSILYRVTLESRPWTRIFIHTRRLIRIDLLRKTPPHARLVAKTSVVSHEHVTVIVGKRIIDMHLKTLVDGRSGA